MSILSELNEATARRGVQVYGRPPTLAPTRRTATPPRVPVGGMSRLERAVMRGRQNQQAQQVAKEAAEPEWWQKGLGIALGNPLTRALLGPLDVIDRGRRAAVYGAAQAAKAIPEKWENVLTERMPAFNLLRMIDEERANQGFVESNNDPSYGYGDVAIQIPKGSPYAKWGNRAVGFGGDVILDPTTYVTGGYGVGSRVAGKAGRANLAAKATRLGMEGVEGVADPRWVGIAERASQYGSSHLTPDDLAKLGVLGRGYMDIAPDIERTAASLGRAAPRNSLRFGGIPIPGTGPISKTATMGGAKLRRAVNMVPGMPKAPLLSKLDHWRSPDGLEAAYTKLTTGRGDMHAWVAAELVDSDNARRMASKTFHNTFVQQHTQAVKELRDENPGDAMRLTEQGQSRWNEIAENAAEMAEDMGVQVYRNRGGIGTKEWVPHYQTNDARRWIASDDELMQDFNKNFNIDIDDLDQQSGVLNKRAFVANPDKPYIVKGREVWIMDDTVDGINEAFRAAFPENKFDMLDTDMGRVMGQYLGGLSRDVGIMARSQRLKSSKSGIAALDNEARVLRQVPDTKDVQKKANKKAKKEAEALQKRLLGRAAQIRAENVQRTGAARRLITQPIQEAIKELPMPAKLKAEIENMMTNEVTLQANRGRLVRAFDEQINEYTRLLDESEAQLEKAKRDALDAIEIGETLKDTERAQLVKRRAKERKRLIKELKANAEALEHDRETLRAIRERITEEETVARKAEVLRKNIPSESFIAAYGGTNVPTPDVRGPMAETLERDRVQVKRYEMLTKEIDEQRAISDAKGREADAINQLIQREEVVPPELLEKHSQLTREAFIAEGLANNYERLRKRVAATYGFTEPEYSFGNRTFTKEELDKFVDAPFDAEIESQTRRINRPPPKQPPTPKKGAIQAAQKKLEAAKKELAAAQVKPSGLKLPSLRRRVRKAKELIRKYEAQVAAEVEGRAQPLRRRSVTDAQHRQALAEVEQVERVAVSKEAADALRAERDRLRAIVGRRGTPKRGAADQLARVEEQLKEIRFAPSVPGRRTKAQIEAAAKRLADLNRKRDELRAIVDRSPAEQLRVIEGQLKQIEERPTRLRRARNVIKKFEAEAEAERVAAQQRRGGITSQQYDLAKQQLARDEAEIAKMVSGTKRLPATAEKKVAKAQAELDEALAERAAAGAYPAQARRHAEEVERAKKRLRMIPEEKRIAREKAGQRISGYRYPRAHPLPAEGRAALTDEYYDLVGRITTLTDAETARMARIRRVLDNNPPPRDPLRQEAERLRGLINDTPMVRRQLSDATGGLRELRKLEADAQRALDATVFTPDEKGVLRAPLGPEQPTNIPRQLFGPQPAAPKGRTRQQMERKIEEIGRYIKESEDEIARHTKAIEEGEAAVPRLAHLEGSMARTRQSLKTPTEIRKEREALTPQWKLPTAKEHPIKDAIKTPQTTVYGSPTIKSRAKVSADDHVTAMATAQVLIEKGDPIVTEEWRDKMALTATAMAGAAQHYEKFPVTDTYQRLEFLQASLRRQHEFTMRYAAAVKAGAPPGDDLSLHVMRSITDAEHEVVRSTLNGVVNEGAHVVDHEVEQMVDLFTSMIEDVANAGNEERWAQILTDIQTLPPDQQIAYLRGRIDFEEAWQETRQKQLKRAKSVARYRRARPAATGRNVVPLQMQTTDVHEQVLNQYNREQRAWRDYQAGRRKTKPVRSVTRAQTTKARQAIADIKAAKKLNQERKAIRTTQQFEVRTALQTGQMTFNQFLQSEMPEARVMDMELALTALPEMSKAKARRLMTEAGISLYGKPGKARQVRIGRRTFDKTPGEYRSIAQRFTQERKAARAYKAGRSVIKPPPPTVTSKQAADAREALKWITPGRMTEEERRSSLIGPQEWMVDQPIQTGKPKEIVRQKPTKLSEVGDAQRRKLAELVKKDRAKLGLEVEEGLPEAYRFSPEHYARTKGLVRNSPALNAANRVTEIERAIAGGDEAIAMLRKQLTTAEEHGLTGDHLALKNLLQTGVIDDDGMALLTRVFDPDTAEFLRLAYHELQTGSKEQADAMLNDFVRQQFKAGQDNDPLMKMARDLENEFGGKLVYNTDTHTYQEMLPPDWMGGEFVSESGEDITRHAQRFQRAITYAALHNARQKSSDQIQILIDTFKTLGFKRGEDTGIMATLGFERSKGIVDEEKLRKTITHRIHGNDVTYANLKQRRIDELERKLRKLDAVSRALGKRETKITRPELKSITGLRGAPRARNIRGNALRKMHLSAVKKMGEGLPPVVYRGRTVPKIDWRQAMEFDPSRPGFGGAKNYLDPSQPGIGGLFKNSPTSEARVLAGHEAAYDVAKESAVQRLAELQTELADIAQRGSAESELPAAQAQLWARKAESQRLQQELERESGSVTREIEEWQARILSNVDDQGRYHQTAVTQFDDWVDKQTRSGWMYGATPPRLEVQRHGGPMPPPPTYHQQLAAIDDMLIKTREAIMYAQKRRDLLNSRRAALQADMAVVRRAHPHGTMELNRYIDDLSEIAQARLAPVQGPPSPTATIPPQPRIFQAGPVRAPEGGIGPTLTPLPEEVDPLVLTETLLQDAADTFGGLFMHDLSEKQVGRFIKDAKNGKAVKVMKTVLDDAYTEMAKGLQKEGQPKIVLLKEVRRHLINIDKAVQNGEIARTIAFFTDFFKTYAVMSPGFQVRNAISAAFMNATEGVGLMRAKQAAEIYKEYRNDSLAFSAKHNMGGQRPNEPITKIGQAMMATFGSGVSGQFGERGVGVTRKNWVFNNYATQLSKWSGEWVEGPVRLALALDSIYRGEDMFDALTRVTRIHFDYSQVSKFDQKMKLVVPFWTFMSRNLPLQISQMWMKPNIYEKYASLVRNFGDEPDPLMPEYWGEQGAFTMGGTMPGTDDELYWAPDLAHTRVQQDIAALADPARLASQLNPLARVPLETLIADRKLYTNQRFTDTPEKMDWKMLPFAPALWAMGSLQPNPEGGLPLVGERGAYAMRSLFPPLQVASRFFPNPDDEFNKERQQQTMLRWLGVPVYQLSDTAKAAELRRQEYAARS